MNSEPDSTFITFICKCGQRIRVPAERAGAKGRCKACGRRLVVPTPEQPLKEEDFVPPPIQDVSPQHRRELEGTYSEEDLITYPRQPPIPKEPTVPPKALEEKKSLFEMLGEILRYPVSDRLATQIFLSGAILFSPLAWKLIGLLRYIRIVVPIPCLIDFLVLGLQFILVIAVISFRLMYFSYMLLIIQRSAEGDRRIPELPVFQTWDQNLKDLVKVLAASAIAFSPFLVYAVAVNIGVIAEVMEAFARGEAPGAGVMNDASSSLGALVLLYAIAAFYMPMVLMILVVTKRFSRAVNPRLVFRSIVRIGREYVVAVLIIFLFLRGALTLLTILKDVLATDWFVALAGYVGEPIVEFYVLVVTMHVIGLLYYRNGDRLEW